MKQPQKAKDVLSHTAVGGVIGKAGRIGEFGHASALALVDASDGRARAEAPTGHLPSDGVKRPSDTKGHPFRILLLRHERVLQRRALKLSANKHQAQDLVQATFLKAWAKRDSYMPDTQLQAWLFTIRRNTFISNYRKYRRDVPDVGGTKSARISGEPRQEHVIALREVMSAVAQLPGIQSESGWAALNDRSEDKHSVPPASHHGLRTELPPAMIPLISRATCTCISLLSSRLAALS